MNSLFRSISLAVCVLGASILAGGVAGRATGQDADASLAIPESDEGLPGAGPIRRYDWFRNLWLQKRSKWHAQAEQDQGKVVFFGDSITQGWGDDFRGLFPQLQAANRGISGDTTRGMLLRLRHDVLRLNPSCVVMLMGTNDLEEKATPATIAENLKLIVAEIKRHDPRLPIVLCLVFPSSASKSRSADSIRQVNKLYQEAVRGDSQVTVLDTWTLFANEQGDAKREEFPDLLHPNGAGYAKWAAAARPVLATLRLLEQTPEPFEVEEGFELLFNGRDLTGWGFRELKSLSPRQAFDGKPASDDGRYEAINGRIVVKTPPEGRKVQQLWTTRELAGDFVLKLEFRATPNADSGVFIRKPQLQCRDYPLAGPYKQLKQYRPQQWNELVVTVKNDVAHCTCNGEVLEEALAVPASGPIGLEGDRGQMEYRRIRFKPLP